MMPKTTIPLAAGQSEFSVDVPEGKELAALEFEGPVALSEPLFLTLGGPQARYELLAHHRGTASFTLKAAMPRDSYCIARFGDLPVFMSFTIDIDRMALKCDYAFRDLQRTAEFLSDHPAWNLLRAKIADMESEARRFENADAYAETEGDEPPYIDSAYFEWEKVVYPMEDLASAFIVTLQTRIAALRSQACRVYQAARVDGVIVSRGNGARWQEDERIVDRICSIGNYIKHRDEWPDLGELTPQQQENYKVLSALSLAKEEAGRRYYVSRLVTKACCKIAEIDSLSESLSRLVTEAEEYSKAAARNLEKDFRPVLLRLWALRDEQSRRARQAEDEDRVTG